MTKRVNSVFIEFEPIMFTEWDKLRSHILSHFDIERIKLINWQTGTIELHNKEYETDIFCNTD